NLGGRSLLRQRLAQIICTLPQLVEEPRVLDGDDGVRDKILDHPVLLGSEGADFLTEHINRADQLIVLEHRNGKYGPITAEFDGRDDKWIAIDVGLHHPGVSDLGYLLRGRDKPKGGVRGWSEDCIARTCLGVGRRRIVHGHGAESFALAEIEGAEFRFADARRVGQYGRNHGLQAAGRARDDAQHLIGRCLPLQRLGKVAPRLGKVPPRLGEFTGARFELLFQLDRRIGPVANVRSRLRSGRTKLAAACWAICAFERQGHLVGTATGPPSGRPGQGSSLAILTEPHDEFPAPHSIASSARASTVTGISRASAFAVLRLMISSNFVGCSIGRSAGFAPLITLTTNAVARLVKSGIFAPYEISPPSATDSLDSYIAGSRYTAARLLICRRAEKNCASDRRLMASKPFGFMVENTAGSLSRPETTNRRNCNPSAGPTGSRSSHRKRCNGFSALPSTATRWIPTTASLKTSIRLRASSEP